MYIADNTDSQWGAALRLVTVLLVQAAAMKEPDVARAGGA
jgi:hypothetical protein